MAKLAGGVLDTLLPLRCLGCGEDGGILCAGCAAGLPRLGSTLCARCGSPTVWPVARCGDCAGRRLAFASSRSAVAYEGLARRIVAAWKEGGCRTLAQVAAGSVAMAVPRPPVELVTSVPGDPQRTRWRGANPAQELAEELAGLWGLEQRSLLVRAAGSQRQRALGRASRRANVRGAFEPLGCAPQRVVLADDVYTTGETALAASAALRRAGARSVHVVTFARAVRLR